MPSAGALNVISLRARSARCKSNTAFLLACVLLSIAALLAVRSDFCFCSASCNFCSASVTFKRAFSPSIAERISCLLASSLAASTSYSSFITAVMSSSSVNRA